MIFLLSILTTLAWNYNPEPDIAGYRLYWYSTEPTELRTEGPWLFSWDAGNTNIVQFPAQANAFYYFVVTAYNTSGLESDFSNEIFYIRVEP
jgi:hypothetical protein